MKHIIISPENDEEFNFIKRLIEKLNINFNVIPDKKSDNNLKEIFDEMDDFHKKVQSGAPLEILSLEEILQKHAQNNFFEKS
jgi:hypothetical protein